MIYTLTGGNDIIVFRLLYFTMGNLKNDACLHLHTASQF